MSALTVFPLMGAAAAAGAPIADAPASIELYNDGQHAQASTNFEDPLGATVFDGQRTPVPGIEMKVAVESGSAVLVQVNGIPASPDGRTAWAETNTNGQVVIVVAAGAESGPVVVSVSIVDPSAPELTQVFHLRVDPRRVAPQLPPSGLNAWRIATIVATLILLGSAVLAIVGLTRRSRNRSAS